MQKNLILVYQKRKVISLNNNKQASQDLKQKTSLGALEFSSNH